MSNSSAGTSIRTWGWTLSVFLLVSYLVCIGFGLLAPESLRMHEAWAPLLPGFEWLTATGFVIGAVESFLYGWYIAVIGIPLYRYFRERGA